MMTAGQSKHRQGRWVLVLGTLWALTVLAAGCSPERRYKVLSFFFDGVPDPNAPAKTTTVKKGRRSTVNAPERSAIVSRHKPVVEEQCRACHKGRAQADALFAFSAVTPTVCMDCHEKTPRQHAVMHGPVAAKACLWCHSAHESPAPHLLREKTPGICLQCHDQQVLVRKVAEHQKPDVDCLSCHFGHGGSERFLLRPVPTTQRAITLSASTLSPEHAPSAQEDRP